MLVALAFGSKLWTLDIRASLGPPHRRCNFSADRRHPRGSQQWHRPADLPCQSGNQRRSRRGCLRKGYVAGAIRLAAAAATTGTGGNLAPTTPVTSTDVIS